MVKSSPYTSSKETSARVSLWNNLDDPSAATMVSENPGASVDISTRSAKKTTDYCSTLFPGVSYDHPCPPVVQNTQ
jgi:hypothetical protein